MRTHNFPSPTGYSDRTITKAPEWHDLVVLDVLFNNLATGLFLVAGICQLAKPAVFEACACWAYPVSLGLLLIDLALLVLDLGDPLRFHHMLRVFKLSSPMSLGTWCLTAFSLLLTLVVAVEVLVAVGWWSGSGAAWWLRTIAMGAGLPFAFGSAAYKGVLFSTTAQPGWKDARWLGAYLTNSALVLGASELLVIAAILGDAVAGKLLAWAECLLIIVNFVMLGLLTAELLTTLAIVSSVTVQYLVTVYIVFTGAVTPILILVFTHAIAGAAAAFATLALSHLSIRYVLVHLPHMIQRGSSRHL